MSKTSQRKQSAYSQGLLDARDGRGVRWKRHPYMEQYMRGFRHGRKWFPGPRWPERQKPQGLWRRVLAKLRAWRSEW